ncbi:MAG: hypothetical protein JNG86_21435 [Verrucomicrobiaceae bacterium]|nr:hypothetical protein [Verrucomicrobiaceae bacterium]
MSLQLKHSHSTTRHSLFGLACLVGVVVAGGLGSSVSQAGTINFYNQPGDVLLMADGVTALDDNFVFELGAFAAGFTPSMANITEWTTNWKPFARAEAPSISGWNSAISYFNKSGFFQLNGQSDQGLSADVFAAGELAYLWVYNDFSITPGSEWALVTNDSSDFDPGDDWLFPDPTEVFPWEFPLSTGVNPVMGGLHNVQGGGDFAAPLAAFTLQTHVVPEPAGALLIMLAGVVWRFHRARASR